jgi:hypothetical protein
MGSMQRHKGFNFEREVVNLAKGMGLSAERMWGSNGTSRGEHEEVDVIIEDFRGQCKRMAKLPKIIKPSVHVDMQIVREDFGESTVIIPLHKFLKIMRSAYVVKEEKADPA